MNALTGSVIYRMLEEGDIPMVCDLLQATGASIDGMTSRIVYRAVCKDSMAEGDAIVVVSIKDGIFAGCAIALVDRKSYWRSFLPRHPIAAFYVIVRLLAMKISAAAGFNKKLVQPDYDYGGRISGKPSGRTWRESSPSIAKIMHIGVANALRGMGLAKGLYRYLFAVLAERGVKRLDGNSSFDNASSVKLFLSTGFTVERTSGNFFATRDIQAKTVQS